MKAKLINENLGTEEKLLQEIKSYVLGVKLSAEEYFEDFNTEEDSLSMDDEDRETYYAYLGMSQVAEDILKLFNM